MFVKHEMPPSCKTQTEYHICFVTPRIRLQKKKRYFEDGQKMHLFFFVKKISVKPVELHLHVLFFQKVLIIKNAYFFPAKKGDFFPKAILLSFIN